MVSIVTVRSKVINMFTSTSTDQFGNKHTQTSFTIPNRGPNGWDQILGSATNQAISYNTRPVFHVEPKWGDSVRDMNTPNTWYKTNMAGQLSQRCLCMDPRNPCSCEPV